MKERPILFSVPMVRAILEGRKTQTRRIVKPQPHQSEYEPESFSWIYRTKRREVSRGWTKDANGSKVFSERVIPKGSLQSISVHRDYFKDHCPYGKPDDLLWVREAWSASEWFSQDKGETVRNISYRATSMNPDLKGWKPSIHMRRADSRITLLIKSVRIERLQDISEIDAKLEGAPIAANDVGEGYRAGFAFIWRAINGAESWAANPWVWVVDFEKVKP